MVIISKKASILGHIWLSILNGLISGKYGHKVLQYENSYTERAYLPIIICWERRSL
jgi:hypothetical protein